MSIVRGRQPRRNAAILATLALACSAPAAHAAAPVSASAGQSVSVHAAATCATKVTIAGKSTCLTVGASCKRKNESRYAAKGFTCKGDGAGHYRLKRTKQSF